MQLWSSPDLDIRPIVPGLLVVLGMNHLPPNVVKHLLNLRRHTVFFPFPIYSPYFSFCLSHCAPLLHHSQTTGAKVTGLWQRWWQCHSASCLSQYWHGRMWMLPANGCLPTVDALQVRNQPGMVDLTNQGHRMQILFVAAIKTFFTGTYIPNFYVKKRFIFICHTSRFQPLVSFIAAVTDFCTMMQLKSQPCVTSSTLKTQHHILLLLFSASLKSSPTQIFSCVTCSTLWVCVFLNPTVMFS